MVKFIFEQIEVFSKFINIKTLILIYNTVLCIFRKIKNQGYYIINPDKTLSNAEKRILSFLKKRQVNWPGIQSQDPTSEQFSSILHNNNIILYE